MTEQKMPHDVRDRMSSGGSSKPNVGGPGRPAEWDRAQGLPGAGTLARTEGGSPGGANSHRGPV